MSSDRVSDVAPAVNSITTHQPHYSLMVYWYDVRWWSLFVPYVVNFNSERKVEFTARRRKRGAAVQRAEKVPAFWEWNNYCYMSYTISEL